MTFKHLLVVIAFGLPLTLVACDGSAVTGPVEAPPVELLPRPASEALPDEGFTIEPTVSGSGFYINAFADTLGAEGDG